MIQVEMATVTMIVMLSLTVIVEMTQSIRAMKEVGKRICKILEKSFQGAMAVLLALWFLPRLWPIPMHLNCAALNPKDLRERK